MWMDKRAQEFVDSHFSLEDSVVFKACGANLLAIILLLKNIADTWYN